MAGAVAAALGAARLFLLTDVPGVLDKQGELLTDLTPQDIGGLRADGTISGGMIPKLETCVQAVEGGVNAAVILDGRVPHAMLLEVFTRRGAGTLVRICSELATALLLQYPCSKRKEKSMLDALVQLINILLNSICWILIIQAINT